MKQKETESEAFCPYGFSKKQHITREQILENPRNFVIGLRDRIKEHGESYVDELFIENLNKIIEKLK